ncbi:MAG: hypothetical protein ACRCYV_03565 [Aeromonas sp.]
MLNELMREHLYVAKEREARAQAAQALLDSAKAQARVAADQFELLAVRMDAAAAIEEWAGDDELDEAESYADRLLAMLVGIADGNQDGELDEDEHELVMLVLEAAWDYLTALGADEADVDALLNEWDAAAAERLHELVAASLADEALGLDAFVFGDEAQEAVFDATYRKVTAVRNGKKVRVNKRVSGSVRLSGKQKVAIRKAQMKARSASAKNKRLKSMKLRKKSGL